MSYHLPDLNAIWIVIYNKLQLLTTEIEAAGEPQLAGRRRSAPGLSNGMAKRLFNRIADGDSQAFSEFYEGTSGGLYAYFLRVSRSVTTAIELLQTTYIRLWEERKYLVEVTHPMAYIRRIASREVSKYLIDKEADRKTIQLEDAETLLPPELPAFYELELKEVMHKIELAVRQLPPQQQMVFRLGKFEELSEKEIAVRMGLSVSSVNNYMQLAMKKVRKIVLNDY